MEAYNTVIRSSISNSYSFRGLEIFFDLEAGRPNVSIKLNFPVELQERDVVVFCGPFVTGMQDHFLYTEILGFCIFVVLFEI
jgi:hypothetical protein